VNDFLEGEVSLTYEQLESTRSRVRVGVLAKCYLCSSFSMYYLTIDIFQVYMSRHETTSLISSSYCSDFHCRSCGLDDTQDLNLIANFSMSPPNRRTIRGNGIDEIQYLEKKAKEGPTVTEVHTMHAFNHSDMLRLGTITVAMCKLATKKGIHSAPDLSDSLCA
jgi:hypothetical protein